MPPAFDVPASIVGIPPAPCNDRSRFRYRQPCSNRHNFTPNFAQHYSLTSHRGPRDGTLRSCVGPHPGATHDVCRYCIAAAEDQLWFRRARDYIVMNNPPTTNNENNRSPHYLTRLCRLCEHREEILLDQLLPSAPNPLPLQYHPTQAQKDLMNSWPKNRCTCEKKGLYNGTRCLPHRKKFWEEFKKQNAAKRRRNRTYLINIEQGPNRTRIPSTAAHRDNRVTRKLYRACRCGADPVATLEEAVVMQCMACQGIVHFDATPGGTQPDFLTPPAAAHNAVDLAMNSLTTPNRFALG
jgi:hypothetical protein